MPLDPRPARAREGDGVRGQAPVVHWSLPLRSLRPPCSAATLSNSVVRSAE